MIWSMWDSLILALEGYRGDPFTFAVAKAKEWAKTKPLPYSVDIENDAVVFCWEWQQARVKQDQVEWLPVKREVELTESEK